MVLCGGIFGPVCYYGAMKLEIIYFYFSIEKSIFIGKAFKNASIRTKPTWQSSIVYLLPKDKTIKIEEIVSSNKDVWYKTSFGYISNLVMDIEEEY